MILQHLSILNYKNIAQAELDLSPHINCFIGQNGEGKTNVLDAIYFLSLCKSSTSAQDSFVIKHDEPFLALQGNYVGEDGTPEEIHCAIKRGQKKILRRGKKPYKRIAEHIGLIPLVIVSPSDHLLINGGSEERRRFMDIVISQYNPSYMESLMRYNRALQQRNVLLKQEEPAPDVEILKLFEEQMAEEGTYIYKCRKAYIEEFIPIFQQHYTFISEGHEEVGLQYQSHGSRGDLLDVIQRDRHKDLAVGYSLHGTHKDDLEMMLGDYPIRREGSQGQNKSYLIALKLAQFDFLRRTGSKTTPLLLLDDIFDKLDAQRVEQIVKLVGSPSFGQIFITDTNRDHLDSILRHASADYKLFRVQQGTITDNTHVLESN